MKKKIPFDLEKYKNGAKVVCEDDSLIPKTLYVNSGIGYGEIIVIMNDLEKGGDIVLKYPLSGVMDAHPRYDLMLEVEEDEDEIYIVATEHLLKRGVVMPIFEIFTSKESAQEYAKERKGDKVYKIVEV